MQSNSETAYWHRRRKNTSKVCNHYENCLSVCCVGTGTSVRDSRCSRGFLPTKLFLRLVSGTGPRAAGFVSTRVKRSTQARFYSSLCPWEATLYFLFNVWRTCRVKHPERWHANLFCYVIHRLGIIANVESSLQTMQSLVLLQPGMWSVKHLLLRNLGFWRKLFA